MGLKSDRLRRIRLFGAGSPAPWRSVSARAISPRTESRQIPPGRLRQRADPSRPLRAGSASPLASHHPNICTLSAIAEGRSAIPILELIEGRTCSRPPQRPERCRSVACARHCGGSRGRSRQCLIHRDLKPPTSIHDAARQGLDFGCAARARLRPELALRISR